MIKFQALMQSIHQSIHSAAQAVEAEGQKHIDKFFNIVEDTDGNGELNYKPKTVDMEFPSRTVDGCESVVVKVPLIALSPISTPRISEVKFTTELEISTNEDDELMVSFPTVKKSGFFSGSEDIKSSSNTRIEITLTGQEPPEGLQKVIEGYERALRAQIPG